MTQQDLYEYLKKHRRWFSTREIAEILGISCGSACRGLKCLNKHGEVLMKKIKDGVNKKPFWRIK